MPPNEGIIPHNNRGGGREFPVPSLHQQPTFTAMSTQSNDLAPDVSLSPEEDMPEEITPHLATMAFWVKDFAPMRRFYSEVIGIPEVWYGNALYDCVVYGNPADGFSFMLCQSDECESEGRGWTRCPKPGSIGENWHPYVTFYVPDIRAVVDRCRAAGIETRTEEPFSLGEGYGWSIEVKTPDGNAIAITQRG